MNDHLVDIAPALAGRLHLHAQPRGLVLLIDSSAGVREQGRQRFIAGVLQRRQFATLQLEPAMGPFTPGEAGEADAIHQLSRCLWQAISWARQQPRLPDLRIGIYASGHGAAAAILCAAEQSDHLSAIVAAAPPLDLVGADVARVRVPVLLVVAGLDEERLAVARQAYRQLASPHKRIELIPRATRLFEEAGALDRVAITATDWFERHLAHASTH